MEKKDRFKKILLYYKPHFDTNQRHCRVNGSAQIQHLIMDRMPGTLVRTQTLAVMNPPSRGLSCSMAREGGH